MRISSVLLLLPIAACGQQAREQQQAVANEQQAEAAAPHFPCATGSAALAPDCTAERTRTTGGWIVTLRHPDGHFRRILVKDDGTAMAADGAERATVTPAEGGQIEIAIAGDRYRLPATR